MAYLLDSSALVKYYVTEPGSSWVRQQVGAEGTIFLAEISLAEVAAALSILQRQNRISPRHRRELWDRFERDWVIRFDPVPVTTDVIYRAALLCAQHPLKAYDAVQLATGLTLREALTKQGVSLLFVSGDNSLVAAARAEGLAVDNPFWHTDLDPS